MASLRELQQSFADAIFAADETAPSFQIASSENANERFAVYRRAVFNNYRKALAASYPVVKQLVGAQFFDTAVDHFAREHPSASGDLNLYGGAFGDFLARYPHAAHLPYLPAVARLEWAIDESNRAPDCPHAPDNVLAALSLTPPGMLPALSLRLEASCRLVASSFPILRIWQVHQPGYDGDWQIELEGAHDTLLVRRSDGRASISRLAPGEYAWLAALGTSSTLGQALEAGHRADASFDFGAVLREHVLAGTIAGVVTT